jgi:phosphoribosyl 1,2-cyclic phosphate phosphodiesterase
MEVTLLGTGDTTGTPTPACDCDTCGRARELGVERSRFSVHVRSAAGESLLIDASPDFRRQFLDNDVALPDAVLIYHVHFDHLDGLGNLYRLVGPRGNGEEPVPVYASSVQDELTEESVAETVDCKYDYLDAVAAEPRDPLEPFGAAGLDVELVPVDHPPLSCYGVVVTDPGTGGTLALTGDTTYDVPPESRERLAGADLMLADALVPAHLCEHHPLGGAHHDDDGVPRTFGTKHVTFSARKGGACRWTPVLATPTGWQASSRRSRSASPTLGRGDVSPLRAETFAPHGVAELRCFSPRCSLR